MQSSATKPPYGPHCARLRARSTAPKNDEVTNNGAFEPVEALRCGVRPSKDVEYSAVWVKYYRGHSTIAHKKTKQKGPKRRCM